MPGTDRERVAAVVLAAGVSSRMGRNKMLLAVEGEPLVRRAVTRASAAGLDPVVAVVGFEDEQVGHALDGLACEVVTNPDYRGPMSRSFHAGLRALAPDVDAAVVMLADMPHVTSAMIAGLVAAARTSRAALVVSRYGEVTAPPILFRRALFDELLAWHGEGCGKPVVRGHAGEAVYLDWPAAALEDVDTPEDLARLTRASG